MNRILRWFAALVLLFMTAPAGATVRYRVSFAQPDQHLFHITMTVSGVRQDLVVALPAWNSLYQIRDFAYRVQNVRAHVEQNEATGRVSPLALLKLDKQTWRITAPPGTSGESVVVEYAVYWDEPGPFSSQLNAHHAFMNFADILLYVPDRRGEDTRVEFADVPAGWKTAVELPQAEGANAFAATTYDALVDAPAELSAFDEFRLETNGARVRVVVDGGSWDRGKLSNVLSRLVGYETTLMHGVPFQEYTFFFHFGSGREAGRGGMEHANCTAIATESGASAAGVAAHEFFHLWNVKRIRPKSLEPVDYAREQFTRSLWFAEGVTSTYGAYSQLRSGLWDRKQFYTNLAGQFTELDSCPARHWKSVEEASLDAWFEKYAFYGRPDYSISYYNKGQILGVMLDLLIRDATNNHESLDDVLRKLNDDFARHGRFYNDSADLRAVAEQVAGRSLEEFFRRYVSGTDEIPYNDFLALAGLHLKSKGQTVADWGFWTERGAGNSFLITAVEAGGNAERAGVREGDEVFELNGGPFPRNPVRWVRERAPGETVRVGVRRDGAEMALSFALAKRDEPGNEIEEATPASDRQIRIREGLLRGTTD